jgi:hypothetical protein
VFILYSFDSEDRATSKRRKRIWDELMLPVDERWGRG